MRASLGPAMPQPLSAISTSTSPPLGPGAHADPVLRLRPPGRHGLAGVEHQVEDHLAQPARPPVPPGQLPEVALDHRPLGQPGRRQAQRLGDDVVDVDQLQLAFGRVEGPQVGHDLRHPPGAVAGVLGLLQQLAGGARADHGVGQDLPQVLDQLVEVGEHEGQRVVDLVPHPGHQQAQAGQARVGLGLGRQPARLGDVPDRQQHAGLAVEHEGDTAELQIEALLAPGGSSPRGSAGRAPPPTPATSAARSGRAPRSGQPPGGARRLRCSPRRTGRGSCGWRTPGDRRSRPRCRRAPPPACRAAGCARPPPGGGPASGPRRPARRAGSGGGCRWRPAPERRRRCRSSRGSPRWGLEAEGLAERPIRLADPVEERLEGRPGPWASGSSTGESRRPLWREHGLGPLVDAHAVPSGARIT